MKNTIHLILDFLKNIFLKNQFAENLLIKFAPKKLNRFYNLILPRPCTYTAGNLINVNRNKINYQLDKSEFIDHAIYFKRTSIFFNSELYKYVKEGMNIIDVGTNIGNTLLSFAKYVGPKGNVWGFEPNTKNYLKAIRNINLNSFDNINLIKSGVGAKTEIKKLFVVNESNHGMNKISNNNISDDFEEINVVTLDEFCNKNKITKVDIIKIDVEGFEYNVLKGALEVITINKPTMFIEIDEKNLLENNSSSLEIFEFLENLGYQILNAYTGKKINISTINNNFHIDVIATFINVN